MISEQSGRIQKARADISKAILNLSAAKMGANPIQIVLLSKYILELNETRKKIGELLGQSDSP